jgi:hypothetical protein
MKRGKKKINFSNRFIFLLITLGILGILAGGVYAISSSGANSGHPISDINPPSPCTANQYLQFDGTNWKCTTLTDTRCDTSGTCSKLCIGTDCKNAWPTGSLIGLCYGDTSGPGDCTAISPATCSIYSGTRHCSCISGYVSTVIATRGTRSLSVCL